MLEILPESDAYVFDFYYYLDIIAKMLHQKLTTPVNQSLPFNVQYEYNPSEIPSRSSVILQLIHSDIIFQ